jgi:hypothetical protein
MHRTHPGLFATAIMWTAVAVTFGAFYFFLCHLDKVVVIVCALTAFLICSDCSGLRLPDGHYRLVWAGVVRQLPDNSGYIDVNTCHTL